MMDIERRVVRAVKKREQWAEKMNALAAQHCTNANASENPVDIGSSCSWLEVAYWFRDHYPVTRDQFEVYVSALERRMGLMPNDDAKNVVLAAITYAEKLFIDQEDFLK